MNGTSRPPARDYVECRGCHGTAPRPDEQGARPVGWYGLSVQVPAGWTAGRNYVWVGLWCSVQCLLDTAGELLAQEAIARAGYDVVAPSGGNKDRRGAA